MGGDFLPHAPCPLGSLCSPSVGNSSLYLLRSGRYHKTATQAMSTLACSVPSSLLGSSEVEWQREIRLKHRQQS